jgi:hypothetical protein
MQQDLEHSPYFTAEVSSSVNSISVIEIHYSRAEDPTGSRRITTWIGMTQAADTCMSPSDDPGKAAQMHIVGWNGIILE